MRILLATNNGHKAREIQQIDPGVYVLTPKELGIRFTHEETGDTFAANAWGKAHALRQLMLQLSDAADAAIDAVLADDSGICVDALDGRPGLYSARYGINHPSYPAGNDAERNALLLSEMEGIANRSARYVCSVAAIIDTNRFICAEDILEGEIALQPSQGSGGFGYDPIFFLPELGCTAADISAEEKHRISHRGKAVRQVLHALSIAVA